MDKTTWPYPKYSITYNNKTAAYTLLIYLIYKMKSVTLAILLQNEHTNNTFTAIEFRMQKNNSTANLYYYSIRLVLLLISKGSHY